MLGPPRVLMVSFFYPPTIGGLPQQARLLAGQLAQLGVPISVVSARLAGQKNFEMDNDVPVHRLMTFTGEGGYRRRAHPWLLPLALFLLARRRDYDILHIQQALHPAALSVLLAKILGKKTMIKVTGSGATGNMAMLRTWWWLGGLARFLLTKADCLVSLSQAITEELLNNGIQPAVIVQIPNGVEVDLFQTAAPAPGLTQRVVLAVGRLTQEKGFDILVKAWPSVMRKVPDAHLIILGDGTERAALESAAQLSGMADHISFMGESSQVPNYLAASQVFVLPSRSEGMANALLEAMAAGRACLASDIRPNAALIQPGINGLLFKSEDAADLAAHLVRLLLDEPLRAQLGRVALQTVLRDYSIEAVASTYLHLYNALIDNRPLPTAVAKGEAAD